MKTLKIKEPKKCSSRKACRIINNFLDNDTDQKNPLEDFFKSEENGYMEELRDRIRKSEEMLKKDVDELYYRCQMDIKYSGTSPLKMNGLPLLTIPELEHCICIRLMSLYSDRRNLERLNGN